MRAVEAFDHLTNAAERDLEQRPVRLGAIDIDSSRHSRRGHRERARGVSGLMAQDCLTAPDRGQMLVENRARCRQLSRLCYLRLRGWLRSNLRRARRRWELRRKA